MIILRDFIDRCYFPFGLYVNIDGDSYYYDHVEDIEKEYWYCEIEYFTTSGSGDIVLEISEPIENN